MNKNVSYHKIQGQEKKDTTDVWIKTIARPVLSKAIHACSDHFTEVHLMKAKRSPQHLLGDILKYILKPDAAPSLFPNGKTVNKSVSSNIEKTIKLGKVKDLCLIYVCEKCKKEGFSYRNT